MFVHIIRNASDAMQEGTRRKLVVRTAQVNGSVVIEFDDTGAGVSEPQRVFDPFYTTKAVGQGPGLGLSACYGIVEEHRGRIRCENLPGGGARFAIEMPALETPALHAPPVPIYS